jgi:hypothetical protein
MSRVHEPCEPLSVLVLGSIMDPAMADADTWLVLGMGHMAGSEARVLPLLHEEEGETIMELTGGENQRQLDFFEPGMTNGSGAASVLIGDEFQARMGGPEWGNKLQRQTMSSWCLL